MILLQLLLLLVIVCYSFERNSITSRYRITSLSSSLPYNPFDDNDNDIRKLIDNEKRNIISSDITNNAMKNELKQFGRGQGIVDKVTLIDELAKLRVMNRISNKQYEDAVNNDREDKAMRLINEIDKINNNYSGILRQIFIFMTILILIL